MDGLGKKDDDEVQDSDSADNILMDLGKKESPEEDSLIDNEVENALMNLDNNLKLQKQKSSSSKSFDIENEDENSQNE